MFSRLSASAFQPRSTRCRKSLPRHFPRTAGPTIVVVSFASLTQDEQKLPCYVSRSSVVTKSQSTKNTRHCTIWHSGLRTTAATMQACSSQPKTALFFVTSYFQNRQRCPNRPTGACGTRAKRSAAFAMISPRTRSTTVTRQTCGIYTNALPAISGGTSNA